MPDLLAYVFNNKLPDYVQFEIEKVAATGPWDSPLFLMAFCTSLQLADIAANVKSGKCERLFFLWVASVTLAMLRFSYIFFNIYIFFNHLSLSPLILQSLSFGTLGGVS